MAVFLVSSKIWLHNLLYIVVKKTEVIDTNIEYLIFGIDIKLNNLHLIVKLNNCGMVRGKV